MNTIIEWAEFYKDKRLWIYPYNLEEKQWVFWKNLKSNEDYNTASETWHWNEATGIKLVVGKKGIRVIEVKTKRLLKKALQLLGLPDDYSWVIYGQSGYGIVVDTPNTSNRVKGMSNRSYKQVLLLWEGYYVLPSTDIPRYFYKNMIPTGHPRQVLDDVFLNCLETLITLYK